MRCFLGEKKLRKYSNLAGKEFIRGLVRGNTNHRIDLIDKNGNKYSYYFVNKMFINADDMPHRGLNRIIDDQFINQLLVALEETL